MVECGGVPVVARELVYTGDNGAVVVAEPLR
jgi:regulator of RNase E activity RraA